MSNHSSTGALPTGTLQGVILLLPCTLSVMGIVVLVPILPQLMAQFSTVPNHDYLIQGGVLTLPSLCIMLFSPLAGWLADRLGRRRLLMISMAVYAFLGVAPVFLDNLFAIIATRMGVGLCEAVLMTTSTTLISDYFSETAREKWLASQTAVASLSSLVLIYIGGQLGSLYGWRGPFGVYLFSLVLLIGVWRFTWEPRTRAVPSEPSLPETPRTPFPWMRMGGICFITIFASVMFFVIQTQNSLALSSLGIHDPARLGTLTAIASLGVPLGTLVFRGVMRLSVGILLCVEFIIIGAGFIWMGKAVDPHTFVLAAGLNQVGCGMILPTLLTWATRGLAFDIRGRGTGLWQGTFAVGQFLSGMVVTFIAALTGGLLPAFVVLGIGALMCALFSLAGHWQHTAFRTTRQVA